MSPGRKRGRSMLVAALHTLCVPGGVPRGVPIPVGVLGVWGHSGAGGGCCGLAPGVKLGCRCLKLFWGKGGVCLLLAFLCGEERPLLAANGTQRPDTVREECPRSGIQAGVTLCWQLGPSPPIWQPLYPSLTLRALSLQGLSSVGVRAEGFGHPWP